jgi:hypothetical protein
MEMHQVRYFLAVAQERLPILLDAISKPLVRYSDYEKGAARVMMANCYAAPFDC